MKLIKYLIMVVGFFLSFSLTAKDVKVESAKQNTPKKQEPVLVAQDTSGFNLYSGTQVKAGELQEVVYISNCTATVVGPETVITAAHCRSTGSTVSFTYKPTGTTHSGTCTRHPQYSSDYNNDYVLCKFSPAISIGSGPMASIGKGENVQVGSKLTLTGFGQPNSGVHYWGESTVSSIDNMQFITSGSSYLGPGDSGGPAFYKINDRTSKEHHWIVGINSRVGGSNSYLNRTDLQRATSWYLSWANEHNTKICGINLVCHEEEEKICQDEISALKATQAQFGTDLDNLEKCFGEGNECIDGMNKVEFGHSKLMSDYLTVRRCWQMNR